MAQDTIDLTKLSDEELDNQIASYEQKQQKEQLDLSSLSSEELDRQIELMKPKEIVTDIPMDTTISAAPKGASSLKPMTIEEQAATQNIAAISRTTGQRLSDVATNYKGKTPETGLRRTVDIGMYRDPTTKQLAQAVTDPYIKGAIAGGLATNPIGTALGLATAVPVFHGLDWAIQKGEEFLPKGTPSEIKEAIGAAGFLGSLYVGGRILSSLHASKPVVKIENAVKNAITKSLYKSGIKPTPSEMKNFGAVKNYEEGVNSAVGQIYNDKDSLIYIDTDPLGRQTQRTGLPQSVSDLVQAIPQVKQKLWNKISDTYQSVTDRGFVIDSSTLSKGLLLNVSKDKVLKLNFPSALKYAREKAAVLRKAETYTPLEVEDFIKSANRSLDKVIKSREPVAEEIGGKAYVDAMLADIMRNKLDESVLTAGEPSLKPFRKQYADLKMLEKYANQTYSKTVGKGSSLLDYFSAYNIGEILTGVATGNPAHLIKGVGGNIAIRLLKSRNHPDNIIGNMFKKIDALNQERLVHDDLEILRRTEIEKRTIEKLKNKLAQGRGSALIPEKLPRVPQKIAEAVYQVQSKQIASSKVEREIANAVLGKILDNAPIELSKEAQGHLEQFKPKEPITVYRAKTEFGGKGHKSRYAGQQAESWTKSKQMALDFVNGDASKIESKTINPQDILIDTTTLPKSILSKIKDPSGDLGNVKDVVRREQEVVLRKRSNKGSALAPAIAATATAVGSVVAVKGSEKEQKQVLSGEASTYGWGEKLNKHTFSGEAFDPDKVSVAMRDVPMGTTVEVTDQKTGKTIKAIVNDGGPNIRTNRVVDLSKAAWKELGYNKPGLTNVEVRIIKEGTGRKFHQEKK